MSQTKSLNLRMAEKDQLFENEESYRLVKHHYGSQTYSLQPISKGGILKATKKLSSIRAWISNESSAIII